MQFDSDKEQVDITMVTDKLCKMSPNSDNFILKRKFLENFLNHTEFYINELTVQLELCIK